jgi:ribosome biogenesis GTPase / thiamine phosphate phosphatase
VGKARKKRKKPVRKRQWTRHDVDTLSRESRARHEDSGSLEAPASTRASFSDVEPNAVVVSPYGMLAFVQRPEGELLCRVHDSLGDGKRSILAPGDDVLIESTEDEMVVTGVRHRRTKLSRPAIGGKREQVIAANVEVLVVVASAAKPSFRPGLVDRYLIAAEVGGVKPILCLNKIDLVDGVPDDAAGYEDLDIPVLATSCVTGEGIDTLRGHLAGKVGVLAGQSGVGKSSLLNTMAPDLDIETKEVSASSNKGQHTTTSSRLYRLDNGIRLVDTPGMKQLGLWDVTQDTLDAYFPEIGEIAAACRFRDCTHIHEPECAVLAALEAGGVTKLRYHSYLRIRHSLEEKKKVRSEKVEARRKT